jgi:hypothetical protein
MIAIRSTESTYDENRHGLAEGLRAAVAKSKSFFRVPMRQPDVNPTQKIRIGIENPGTPTFPPMIQSKESDHRWKMLFFCETDVNSVFSGEMNSV